MVDASERSVLLYRAKDMIEASLLVAMLEESGVEAWTRGGQATIGFGKLGADAMLVDVRVHEKDNERSIGLVNRYFEKPPAGVPEESEAWVCKQCHETVEAAFSMCWSCGSGRDAVPADSMHPQHDEPQPEIVEPKLGQGYMKSWRVLSVRGYLVLPALLALIWVWLTRAEELLDFVVVAPGMIALSYLALRWTLGLSDRPR